MLATSVGVDRAVEGQVGRGVTGDDGFGRLDADFGALGQRHLLVPAIILGHRAGRGEAVVRVVRGTATTHRRWSEHGEPLYCFYIQYCIATRTSSTARRPTWLRVKAMPLQKRQGAHVTPAKHLEPCRDRAPGPRGNNGLEQGTPGGRVEHAFGFEPGEGIDRVDP